MFFHVFFYVYFMVQKKLHHLSQGSATKLEKNTDFDIHILNLRNYYFKNTKNKYVNLQ